MANQSKGKGALIKAKKLRIEVPAGMEVTTTIRSVMVNSIETDFNMNYGGIPAKELGKKLNISIPVMFSFLESNNYVCCGEVNPKKLQSWGTVTGKGAKKTLTLYSNDILMEYRSGGLYVNVQSHRFPKFKKALEKYAKNRNGYNTELKEDWFGSKLGGNKRDKHSQRKARYKLGKTLGMNVTFSKGE